MSRKVNEITDAALLKCMKDFLDDPGRYHPEYLDILLKDYERRVVEKKAPKAEPVPPSYCSGLSDYYPKTI